jgi:SNF2 family DNA or RNA helicase
MATNQFDWQHDDDGVLLFLTEERTKLFRKIKERLTIDQYPDFKSYTMLSGVAHLKLLVDSGEGDARELPDRDGFWVSHKAIAELDDHQAFGLGLPPTIPFQMRVQTQGLLSGKDFVIKYAWMNRSGRPVLADRQGAIAQFGEDSYRVSEPFFSLIGKIENFESQKEQDFDSQVAAIADIKADLPEEKQKEIDFREAPHLDVRIAHATSFSISFTAEKGLQEFNPVLFGRKISNRVGETGEVVDEADQLLPPKKSNGFQELFNSGESTKATYVLETGEYVFLDRKLRQALDVVHTVRGKDQETKKAFIKNPQKFLKEELGRKDELEDEIEQGELDGVIDRLFIETRQFSERIVELGLYIRPDLPWLEKDSQEWLPDHYQFLIQGKVVHLPRESLANAVDEVRGALERKASSVVVGNAEVEPTAEFLATLEKLVPVEPVKEPSGIDEEDPEEEEGIQGPIVLIPKENLQEVDYVAVKKLRKLPDSILPVMGLNPATTLKRHQEECLQWFEKTYTEGWPGVLLADDMGVGKTLQTLAFLSKLREFNILKAESPALIVSPVTLLGNWEKEHEMHLAYPGLGNLLRVYGHHKKAITKGKGKDIDTGSQALDSDAIASSNWVLTTYETLRDYQTSFGSVRFSCVVFDEIQKAKSPRSLVCQAVKTVHADFKIALTGTPVENSLADLHTIMDVISPGFLGDLRSFMKKYSSDDEDELKDLARILLKPQGDSAPPVLRRMKDDIGEELPDKTINSLEEEMPEKQQEAYNDALNRNEAGSDKMLKTLQEFRTISLHPYLPQQAEEMSFDVYIKHSAKLILAFQILDKIVPKKEKVLIFVESRALQPVLAEMIKVKYNLNSTPLIINGAISGEARQKAVDKFQEATGFFDVMVLSPRAAGVGITLTTANHVIHLQRWWNPAVEDQCTDRVYRIGQTKPVSVYLPLAVHPRLGDRTYDKVLHQLLDDKRHISRGIFMPMHIDAGAFGVSLGIAEDDNDLDLDEVDCLEPEAFEAWVGQRGKRFGLSHRPTPRSHDGGADLILTHPGSGREAIVQCKHRGNPDNEMGTEPVKDLLRAQGHYNKPEVLLVAVTNAGKYSNTAINLAKENQINLIARNELHSGLSSIASRLAG